ncbi:CGNR zinc finger domain-containing protein [Streptomyces sp. NPDC050085]|uniref:CGNR zinc finger domain-containing protein n=1 Tax=Streptomyces sp. NPDC050085 TaxID=3365600 RepID=UPI0037AEAAC4
MVDERTLLTGEPLALDLINTRPAGGELIGTARQLTDWLTLQADRLPIEARGLAPRPADLAALHAVRADIDAAIRALLDGAAPPNRALRGLGAAQREAPAIRELAWDGRAVTATPRRTGSPGTVLAAVFAEAATDLLTSPSAAKIKECEAGDCVLLFLPAHPRRRWCSATRCGNRARVARYYQRHKSD